jgi:Outer membrane protein beta-barrel domain
MRKVSMILGLALFALAGSARAQDEAPAPAPAGDPAAAPAPAPETVTAPAPAPAASDSKMQLGLNLLPMLIGKTKTDFGGSDTTADMKMAYGVGLHFDYLVIPGLTVGVAPQLLLNVKDKDATTDASKAYDLLARVAYTYTVAPKIGVYAELLPGYSIVAPPSGDKAKGFVIAGGVGGVMDVTDQVFVNLGVGYQYGLQKVDSIKANLSYLRIAVGAGMKF